ncbi:ABC transporter ATP-binding protein [Pelistega sp. MC2]|uniref:ABC transporter ATP-binding protein n=1 Tax=Pelistega sp. MC2 TaxID=1720297 RepID=UPI0004CEC7DF|nr:ATP-binding cassette domain-containing protein [Pelistega sp. MC2]
MVLKPDHETILLLENVSLGYGERTILADLNVRVRQGEVVALIGGSGSGKTTLLRGATGQIRPQKGKISLYGQDVSLVTSQQLQQLRQRMGVLFQQGALFTDLDVFDNVAFPLRELTNNTEKVIFEKVLDKLDAVGLRSAAHLKLSEVSGGMARRVALARTIVLEPDLILYDEPFAGLDPISLGMTAQLIRDTANRLKCGALLITHDIEESFKIVDYVYMLGQGKIIMEGTPNDFRHSDNPYVQQFLQASPTGPVVFEYPETSNFQQWYAKRKEQLK